ncbi:hypothetical protein RvY_04284 [Ramazzottius varieornatus]|uniref:Uncharacterized protein n=1 Tax=Ramazzottius varieornatus TaxID=947166 RepID=A0A1D1UR44_RAMVA|nr:hypothetical protein RvY_04284 [Ramazzottius varieornatus]
MYNGVCPVTKGVYLERARRSGNKNFYRSSPRQESSFATATVARGRLRQAPLKR